MAAELITRAELGAGGGEVAGDLEGREEERLGDLAVARAVAGEAERAALGRGQDVVVRRRGLGAQRRERGAGAGGDGLGAAAEGEVQGAPERRRVALGLAERAERLRELEPRRRALEHVHRLAQQRQSPVTSYSARSDRPSVPEPRPAGSSSSAETSSTASSRAPFSSSARRRAATASGTRRVHPARDPAPGLGSGGLTSAPAALGREQLEPRVAEVPVPLDAVVQRPCGTRRASPAPAPAPALGQRADQERAA